jgi:GNAT superfamily N-acetyltransferase
LLLRLARIEERDQLEDLQRRASLALDEYREALLAHPDAISLAAEQIERGEVVVAEIDGRIAGFAVVLDQDGTAELDGLFVEPESWRQGVGSALVEDAVHDARRRGLTLMTVVANPGAREFYERCGFTVEGSAETRFGPALRMSR